LFTKRLRLGTTCAFEIAFEEKRARRFRRFLSPFFGGNINPRLVTNNFRKLATYGAVAHAPYFETLLISSTLYLLPAYSNVSYLKFHYSNQFQRLHVSRRLAPT
jgi:hypothetical protein